MPFALIRALTQLPDPRFRRVLWRSAGLTLIGALLLALGAGWGLSWIQATDLPWLDSLLDGAAGLVVFILALVFFPSLAGLIASFFLEEIARAVEARHYPALPAPRTPPLRETVGLAARFALISAGLNLLALPLYLLLPGLNLVLYYALNGMLLSREFFEQAAQRRLEPAQADALARRHRGRLWLTGAALAFLATLPGANLLLPLIATATLVHVVERLRPAHTPDAPASA
ncbi:EI24 domain-containing protein [Pararhodospirillum oryzae]|uniref:Cysteine biosynthesis protein n=1 Tax=Pararhodospirillum oryzae TaxID=478448 RepID=A0A512H8Z2_9PROT|nr:EI24 domain-containing protein [Pararhodospirillum oryzae]GEO81888.1 hypothetical protein ROR02_20190 [Pararhodospirillum oryzae]